MGIVYTRAYADEVNHPVAHEGYVARLLPDGRLSSTWNDEEVHIGLVGACSCGWRAARVRPPGEDDGPEYEWALGDFHSQHLEPLIAQTAATSWPTWTRRITGQANRITALIAAGRLEEAHHLLDTLREETTQRMSLVAELIAEQRRDSHECPDSPFGRLVIDVATSPTPGLVVSEAHPPPPTRPSSPRSSR